MTTTPHKDGQYEEGTAVKRSDQSEQATKEPRCQTPAVP